jgi:hypothetical protein
MFERYTEKARRLIFFARYEASRYGSRQIEPEHLLFGLLREPSPLVKLLFASRDSMDAVRKEIESLMNTSPAFSESSEVPLSETSRRILIFAAKEADRLSHEKIDSDHIFFAIFADEQCLPGRVLRARGLKVPEPQDASEGQATSEQSSEASSAVGTSSDALPGIPEWEEMGIPKGYGFAQLLFNPPTEILIAELCHGHAREFLPNRLFWRRKNEEGYKPLGEAKTNCSQESAVTAASKPVLFFNSLEIIQENSGRSGNWDALYTVDLETMTIASAASRRDLRLPAPYTDGWITDLLHSSDDGETLYLAIGMCELNGTTRQNIAYYLAQFEIASKNLRTISRLRGSFF